MMASREELIQSIQPGVVMDETIFRKIYGYDITTPGFADNILDDLEDIYILYDCSGESNPRERYKAFTRSLEDEYERELKKVSKWYNEKIKEEHERKAKKTVARNREPKYQFNGFPEDW